MKDRKFRPSSFPPNCRGMVTFIFLRSPTSWLWLVFCVLCCCCFFIERDAIVMVDRLFCILISQFCQRHVSRWTTLADKQVENPEFKLKGYQIALQFVPPRDLFKRSHLLSKMLLLCCESGSSFQTMASLFMCAANEIEVCEQEVGNNNSITTLTNEAQH